jgi:hypothetical protein
MMKPKVYLETTVPSYLTAWPSRDLIRAAHQQITLEWWERRDEFDLFISELVVQECREGDPKAAADRLEAIRDLPLLQQSKDSVFLSRLLVEQVPLPKKAAFDALHVAIAVVHGMDFLLTWNCTHIANAHLSSRIESICRENRYEPTIICTPEQLPRRIP